MQQSIIAACVCHRGSKRPTNQDNFYFDGQILPELHTGTDSILQTRQEIGNSSFCCAIFDGMGGEQQGERASFLASQALRQALRKPEDFPDGDSLAMLLHSVNQVICEDRERQKLRSMGSTAALVMLDKGRFYAVNLGDSPIFRVRDGTFQQVSIDHTDENLLKMLGVRRKPALTQHLGLSEEDCLLEPAVFSDDCRTGDLYLLCSDGLTDMVPKAELSDLLSGEKLPALRKGSDFPCSLTAHLLEMSLERGGKDNITIQTITVL